MKPEEQIQADYFDWINKVGSRQFMELEYAYHCPNEVGTRNRVEAIKLAKMGVRPGVPDVFIPVPKRGYHGCYIEFKAGKNETSKAQDKYIEYLEKQGYACAILHAWKTAADFTVSYLMGNITKEGRENNES